MQENLLSEPDECPVCGAFIEPLAQKSHRSGPYGLEMIFECPRKECGRFFVAHYFTRDYGGTWNLNECAKLPEHDGLKVELSAFSQISTEFSEIYRQSYVVHRGGMNLVAGCGYRKALEFLVKDYLVWMEKSDQESIEKIQLGSAVNLLPEGSFRTLIKRAVWLGNDEVHYVKKWGQHVDELKKLIDIGMDVVRADLKAKELEKTMPESK